MSEGGGGGRDRGEPNGADAGAPRGAGGEPPFPSPLQAALLALRGLFRASLVAVLLSGVTSPTTAAGVATVFGIGAAGALGAAHVPPPHAERLGLRGLRLAHLPPLALLLPVALLAAQLDPLLSQWLPAPDAPERAERMREALPTDERLALLETLVVAVGLAPLVEEWLFRGVIQQGLVARLGAGAGIGTTALLFAVAHGGGGLSAQSTTAVVAQVFTIGVAFGFVRHATGSLLAPMLLHAGVNAVGVGALLLGEAGALPDAAAAGGHLPLLLVAGSAAAVALGAWWLRRVPPAPLRPDPPPDPDDDAGD